MSKPREYTDEEVREKFLRHVWSLIHWWENENRADTTHDKLSGLAHSIMAMLDGSTNLPAFIVAPLPHKEDKAYHKANGENYFPYNRRDRHDSAADVKCDIGGHLAYQLYRVKEKMDAEKLPLDVLRKP